MPDILVFYRGRTIGIELKTEKGKPSTDQIDMANRLNSAGVVVHICRSIEDVHDALDLHMVPMRSFNGSRNNTQAKARRPPQPDAGPTAA